jgi:RNA polymerase sigma-70 factor (ECF subfamily)
MGLSDSELLRRVQCGEVELFEQLVLRYSDRLLHVAVHKLRDRSLAEEVVQEVFLAAYTARHTYDGRFAVSTWLWTILLNLCRREWRRQRRGRRPLAGDVSRLLTVADEGTVAGLDRLLAQEQQELLALCLEALPERQADALRLRFFGGLPYEEIAAAMGSSVSGAKRRVQVGLQKLSARLRSGCSTPAGRGHVRSPREDSK